MKQTLFKTTLTLALALTLLFALCSCGNKQATEDAEAAEAIEAIAEATEVPDPVDYSDDSCWVCLDKDGTYPVDTFFIYPTIVMEAGDGLNDGIFSTLNECRESPMLELILSGVLPIFEDCTNVYMPYYHQATMAGAATCNQDHDAYMALLKDNIPYEDITAALDYYFENYNNGRPFIIASHSQGSAMTLNVLDAYMEEHPEYLERMVAAYPVGYGVTQSYMDANPHLSFATGETDTGVIVSWNTEGPGATGKTILLGENTLAINPLNWKTDDTYAGPETNKGSLIGDEIVMNYADAQIDPQRGVVVSNTEMEYVVAEGVFGDNCLHQGDYTLFFNNFKENVAARIAAYLEAHPAQ